MIKSFQHKGIKNFFESGSKAGIVARHADKLLLQLALLNQAKQPEDLNVPSWKLHSLQGNLAGHWSITVSENWRLTFKFDHSDVILLNYHDYH